MDFPKIKPSETIKKKMFCENFWIDPLKSLKKPEIVQNQKSLPKMESFSLV